MILQPASMLFVENKIFDLENADYTKQFLDEQSKALQYLYYTRQILVNYLHDLKNVDENNKNFLRSFAFRFMSILFNNKHDIMYNANNSNYSLSNIISDYIDKHKSDDKFLKTTRLQIKKTLSNYIIYEKYSFDKAIDMLYSNNDAQKRIRLFAKIVLLTDDCLNVDKLHELRNIIISSPEFSSYKPYFGDMEIEKDLISMFLSDYKIIEFLINYYNKVVLFINTKDKNKQKDKDADRVKYLEGREPFVFVLAYGKFIINILIILYQTRIQINFDKSNLHQKTKNEFKNINLDVVLSKIYNIIDFNLYYLANTEMTDIETLTMIVNKMHIDFFIHGQSLFGFEQFAKCSSFITGIIRSINSNDHDYIIKEMIDIAFKEWNNLNAISHIEMIEFIRNKDKKFAKILEIDSVYNKLKKQLVKTCRDNHFPYIQGEDMHKRVKREKSASKKCEKPERKKMTKKMA